MHYTFTSGTWESPTTTGSQPPPCQGFTFTLIDEDRIILFGGYQPATKRRVNDIYILNIHTKVSWLVCSVVYGYNWIGIGMWFCLVSSITALVSLYGFELLRCVLGKKCKNAFGKCNLNDTCILRQANVSVLQNYWIIAFIPIALTNHTCIWITSSKYRHSILIYYYWLLLIFTHQTASN